MFRNGLLAGVLIALTGCVAIVPVVPFAAARPAEKLAIFNLKTVESTVDKSLQDTVAISFVPPEAMSIAQISYAINGKPALDNDYDLVLETAKLKVGEHLITLDARGDASVVRGTTLLTVIESGKDPASADDSAAAAKAGTVGDQAARPSGASTSKASQPSAWGSAGSAPKLAGGATDAKAKVSIRIKMPDE
jgi:hypothetical protein